MFAAFFHVLLPLLLFLFLVALLLSVAALLLCFLLLLSLLQLLLLSLLVPLFVLQPMPSLDSAAGAVGAPDTVRAVVALTPLPRFTLMSVVFGTFLQLCGWISTILVTRRVWWNRLLLATLAWLFGLPHLRPCKNQKPEVTTARESENPTTVKPCWKLKRSISVRTSEFGSFNSRALDQTCDEEKKMFVHVSMVFVSAISKSMAGVIHRKRRHPHSHHEARRQDYQSAFAKYSWHSGGMSTRKKEVLHTMWTSMICVRYRWTIGAIRRWSPKNTGKGKWFQTLER